MLVTVVIVAVYFSYLSLISKKYALKSPSLMLQSALTVVILLVMLKIGNLAARG